MMTRLSIDKINQHEQLFTKSCIPSAVEFVLKQLGKVDINYYELQSEWKNKERFFDYFDGEELFGLKFKRCFSQDHNQDFPLKELFNTISNELTNGRYVIISLASPNGGCHMYIIFKEDENTFKAISKERERTISEEDVKRKVKDMNGTDILIYNISDKIF